MERPLVTAIISVYNGEKYLAQAIKSVLAQDYSPIELIVVDDGSTDQSAGIAQSFEQVNFIQHEVNLGAPSARNTGIKAARGSFIALLDADDRWLPSKIGKQVELLLQNPHLGFCFTKERFLYEDMDQIPAWARTPALQEEHTAYWPSSMLIRKSAFDKVGLFNPEYRQGDATDWILRAKDLNIASGVIDEVLLQRRVHDSNLTSNYEKENRWLLKGLKSSINRQRESGSE